MERFMFPFLAYSTTESVEHKRMPLACIYTMNVSDEASFDLGYHDLFDKYETVLEKLFTKPEHLYVHETYQFSNYDRYVSDVFDEKERRRIHETRFPLDLESAFKIGQNIAKKAFPQLTGREGAFVEIAATADEQPCDGVYVIVDLGAETAGFLDIDVEVPVACRMDVGFGEHLIDGVCRTAIRGFSADLELTAGRNQYLHTFRRFGCRYVQLFIHAPSARIRYAGIRPTLYPLKHKDFRCGNLLRETIYRTCQNTLQHCLHEHYEDCPWREQALYTLDSRNQMLCGYYAFGETRAPRAALELIAHGQRRDGLLMLCYPAGTDAPIPAFSCMYFVQMEEYLRYTGDTSLAVSCYDLLESILATFESRMTDEGVLENFYGAGPDGRSEYWNFYEWSDTMDGRFCETERRLESPLNAFYSLALGAMERICASIGKTGRASELRARRAALNAAIEKKFYNSVTKMFESFEGGGKYTALTQALCLLCGAAQNVDTEVMLEALASNGGRVGKLDVVPNTLSMNAFRYDALLAADRERYAPVILDEIDRDYLYMLQSGATTFWETIVGAADFGGAGSLCHGWSALPVYYYEILLGDGEGLRSV